MKRSASLRTGVVPSLSAWAMEQAASSAVSRSRRCSSGRPLRRRFSFTAAAIALLHFDGRIVGEGMAEVLHDVEAVSATNHAQPDDVVGRVEQVRAMRGRKHEMFVSVLGVVVEGNIFSLLVELEFGRGSETL